MADNRTVLHSLPEAQPDSLGEGTTSNSIHGQSSGVPNKSDTKDVWVDYAVSQGADRDEAEDSTKTDLVERYG